MEITSNTRALDHVRAFFEEHDDSVGFEDLDGQPSAVAVSDLMAESIEIGAERIGHNVTIKPINLDVPWEMGAFVIYVLGNEYEVRVTRRG